LSFCPEIGDATVGSLVVSTSKDSSIDGPGYLSALVAEVTYVDEVRGARVGGRGVFCALKVGCPKLWEVRGARVGGRGCCGLSKWVVSKFGR